MREIRQSGSEGGGGSIPLPTPIAQPQASAAAHGGGDQSTVAPSPVSMCRMSGRAPNFFA